MARSLRKIVKRNKTAFASGAEQAAAVEAAGKSPICPVVALEATAEALTDLREDGDVTAGESLFLWNSTPDDRNAGGFDIVKLFAGEAFFERRVWYLRDTLWYSITVIKPLIVYRVKLGSPHYLEQLLGLWPLRDPAKPVASFLPCRPSISAS